MRTYRCPREFPWDVMGPSEELVSWGQHTRSEEEAGKEVQKAMVEDMFSLPWLALQIFVLEGAVRRASLWSIVQKSLGRRGKVEGIPKLGCWIDVPSALISGTSRRNHDVKGNAWRHAPHRCLHGTHLKETYNLKSKCTCWAITALGQVCKVIAPTGWSSAIKRLWHSHWCQHEGFSDWAAMCEFTCR